MAETRGRGFGHGPSRKQAAQRNLFLRGEEIDRAIIGKIEWQERLAVMGHGFFGPEVARYHGVTNSCIARRFSSGSQKAR